MSSFLDPNTIINTSTAAVANTAYVVGRIEQFYSAAFLKLAGILGGSLTILGIGYAVVTQYYQARTTKRTRETITREIRAGSETLKADIKGLEAHFRKDISASLGGLFSVQGNHFLTQKDPAGALESYLLAARHFAEGGADADLQAAIGSIKELLARRGAGTPAAGADKNFRRAIASLRASGHGHYAAELEKLTKAPGN